MTPAPSCCSGSSPPPTNAAPWASARTGPSTSGDGSCPSTPPPSACSTGCCPTASSSPPTASPTACAKPAPEEVTAPPSTDQPRGAGTLTWPPAGTPAWPLTLRHRQRARCLLGPAGDRAQGSDRVLGQGVVAGGQGAHARQH